MGAIALIRQTLIDADWQTEARKAGQNIAPNALDPVSRGVPAPGTNATDEGTRGETPGGRLTPILFTTDDELDVLRAAKIAKEFKRPAVMLGSGTEFRRLEALGCRLGRVVGRHAPEVDDPVRELVEPAQLVEQPGIVVAVPRVEGKFALAEPGEAFPGPHADDLVLRLGQPARQLRPQFACVAQH